jgi:peptidoglycan hydrolase CwlO-like protein
LKKRCRDTAGETVIMIIRSNNASRKIATLLIGMFLLAGAVQILPAKTSATNDTVSKQQQESQIQIDGYKKRQKNLQLEIKKGRREVKTFTRKESDIIKRLNRVERSLNKNRKLAAVLEK